MDRPTHNISNMPRCERCILRYSAGRIIEPQMICVVASNGMIRKESTYISRWSLLRGLMHKLVDSELFVGSIRVLSSWIINKRGDDGCSSLSDGDGTGGDALNEDDNVDGSRVADVYYSNDILHMAKYKVISDWLYYTTLLNVFILLPTATKTAIALYHSAVNMVVE